MSAGTVCAPPAHISAVIMLPGHRLPPCCMVTACAALTASRTCSPERSKDDLHALSDLRACRVSFFSRAG